MLSGEHLTTETILNVRALEPRPNCGKNLPWEWKGRPMTRDNRPHNWNREQPHHVDTGRITTEDYARRNPGKVEWVKEKN